MSLTIQIVRHEIWNACRTENANYLLEILHNKEARQLMQEDDIRNFYTNIIQSASNNTFHQKLESMNMATIFEHYFPQYIYRGNFCTPQQRKLKEEEEEEKKYKLENVKETRSVSWFPPITRVHLSATCVLLCSIYWLTRIAPWVQKVRNH